MPAVNALISKFENIVTQETPPSSTQRVRGTRHSMPLRQSTLKFNAAPADMAQKRQSMSAVASKQAVQEPTPPIEEPDNDTIVVNTADESRPVQLPTPSESATDVSSQGSNTPVVKKIKSPPKSRSKRVSNAMKSASKDALVADPAQGANATADKQRNISGETLVEEAGVSKTTLLKEGINALDLKWNMSNVFNRSPAQEEAEEEQEADDSSTIEVAVDAGTNLQEQKQHREAKRAKIVENTKKWEQRRKVAEKNATRRSSRASMLLTKANDLVSEITSTVLGKRVRDAAKGKEIQEEQEPDSKKARIDSPSANPQTNDATLSSVARAMRSRAPKDKKWLISGLYAGQSRAFDPSLNENKNKRKFFGLSSTLSNSQKESSVLPMPMFAGARLLTTGRDFKLPFDVFSPLPTGQPKPDEWKKVNKNVFIGDATDQWRTSKFLEHSTCLCTLETGCDANCMNRFMYYECDSRNCNLTEEQCGNRAFEELRQRVKKGGKYNVGVEVIKTNDRGYGVRANRTFEPNQIIVEYTGEIINQEECENRMHGVYKDNEVCACLSPNLLSPYPSSATTQSCQFTNHFTFLQCYYLMAFDQNMIIDATRGSIARFVNHSCAPNSRMEKWTVGGKPRMALFAGDSGIMTGEELTYDYNFDPYSQKNVQQCRCGSANCRGVLGPKPKDAPKRVNPAPVVGGKKEGGKKEGKLAGAKRKIAEVLEESTSLINKRRKTIEPVSRRASLGKDKKPRASINGTVKRQPSKLRRMLSEKSSRSSRPSTMGSVRSSKRVVSTSSQAGLITKEQDDADEPEQEDGGRSSVSALKAKAESIRRNVARSLRGAR
ncbi:hypothetical protein H2198_001696 [Neophaeococcomyces mojaviensis]|uniref:Uncharacterized protein n=1 Tax=Neophaeococcomyces mojaviensis TaxID=3383035 RepID=A0ACC3AGD1_9EURO|nr:hypothetical protein H2198_001696 [Knufia sp. JES_112]